MSGYSKLSALRASFVELDSGRAAQAFAGMTAFGIPQPKDVIPRVDPMRRTGAI